MEKLTNLLMSDMDPEDILDLLFYNFYDLDRFNRVAMGDAVLRLGRRDAVANYVNIQKEKEARALALKNSVTDMTQLPLRTDETKIKEIGSKAFELVGLSHYLNTNDITADGERRDYRYQYDHSKLNYSSKFGDIGKILSDALSVKVNKKGWKKFTAANNSKNKFLSAMEKKHNNVSNNLNARKKDNRKNYSVMNDSNESGMSGKSKYSAAGKLGGGFQDILGQRAASSMNMKGNPGKMSALGVHKRRADGTDDKHRSNTAMGKSSRVASRVASRKNSVTVVYVKNSL